MATVKIIEVIGSSEHSWEDAVQNAVKSAAKTLRQLVGADVQSWTAKIGPDSKDHRIPRHGQDRLQGDRGQRGLTAASALVPADGFAGTFSTRGAATDG